MKTFLSAYWKNLLMLNYSIEPSVLQPFVPQGTELDFFQGKCYVSLVGFMFLNTKLKGIGVPFHQNFEEVNLRFYVRFKENNEWKRGVVFIKEIVPKRMISAVAKIMYGEKYHHLPMKNSLIEHENTFDVKYEWQYNGTWNFLQATANKKSMPIVKGSEEEFITEHYWGYSQLKNNRTSEYNVVHPKWNVHPVLSYNMQCNIGMMYGTIFEAYLSQQPTSVFIAEGSAVQVMHRKIQKY